MPHVMAVLGAEFVTAIRASDVMKQLQIQGSEAVASTADAFRKNLVTELAYWKKLIQAEGIKAEE